MTMKRFSAADIQCRKMVGADSDRPIVALTSYHAHTAAIVDRHAEVILVGDSLGMVMHGMENTLAVSLDLMIMHAQAVVRGTQRALVVVDLPFGSYEESPEAAFRSAVQVMKNTGCGAVKLEGGARMAETIRFLVQRGIPVMAHIGLTPQNVLTMGGYKTQGRDPETWAMHHADAAAVTEAGAFSLVLEGMVEPLAAEITQKIAIPTIGIGASATCDGQILVLEDLLGLNPKPPKFVQVYGDLGAEIERAVAQYADDVRGKAFPRKEHLYD